MAPNGNGDKLSSNLARLIIGSVGLGLFLWLGIRTWDRVDSTSTLISRNTAIIENLERRVEVLEKWMRSKGLDP